MRLVHRVTGLFGRHSHDPAESVDAAMRDDRSGRRAMWLGLGVLAATALAQGAVAAASGSVALLGDCLHNLADALTAVPLLVAFALAARPADARFTYGYGRAEDVAGLFVIAMITLSSGLAGWQAVHRLAHQRPVHHLTAVAVAAGLGFVGNEVVARYRIRVGRRIGSAALVADGLHARTDGFTSLAVLLGAAGSAVGWRWADPVVGLLITVVILGALRQAIIAVGARLLDAVDPALARAAAHAAAAVPGVAAVRELRIRWIGHTLRAEVDVDVDPALSVGEAHHVAHHVERHLLAALPRLTGATIHVGPAGAHAHT
ncbi:MAG TPA: cation diffusion facilitator family transporter [Sporichthyaceae bacterium]|nr:cation diffusion facilitator family transporter [Sporichthyaceae bacterium]